MSSVKRDAAKIRKLVAALRETAKLEADDLVFLTFHQDNLDRFVTALRSLGPQSVVIDGDSHVRRGRLLASKLRIDRHAAGET